MTNKKVDFPKLQIFTQSASETLQREIDSIFLAVKDGRLSFEHAMRRLHKCKDDLSALYWYIMNRIILMQGNIRTLADYTEMKRTGYQVELDETELQELMIKRVVKAADQIKQGGSMEVKASRQDSAHDDLGDAMPGFTLIDDEHESNEN